MALLASLGAGLSVALASWVGQRMASQALLQHRLLFTDEAASSLRDLFVFVDARRLWPPLILLAAGVGLAGWLLLGSLLLAVVAGMATLVLPRILLARARRTRLARLDAQLPDALTALGAALRAGASLGVALQTVLQDAQAPLTQEFGLMVREQRMGVPLARALGNLHLRMPSESVQMVVVVLQVAGATGGSVAGLLDRLADTLRARQHLEMKLDMLTSQGKLQAWVIGALPWVLLLALTQVDQHSSSLLLGTSRGHTVLAMVVGLEAVGALMMRRILRIVV